MAGKARVLLTGERGGGYAKLFESVSKEIVISYAPDLASTRAHLRHEQPLFALVDMQMPGIAPGEFKDQLVMEEQLLKVLHDESPKTVIRVLPNESGEVLHIRDVQHADYDEILRLLIYISEVIPQKTHESIRLSALPPVIHSVEFQEGEHEGARRFDFAPVPQKGPPMGDRVESSEPWAGESSEFVSVRFKDATTAVAFCDATRTHGSPSYAIGDRVYVRRAALKTLSVPLGAEVRDLAPPPEYEWETVYRNYHIHPESRIVNAPVVAVSDYFRVVIYVLDPIGASSLLVPGTKISVWGPVGGIHAIEDELFSRV